MVNERLFKYILNGHVTDIMEFGPVAGECHVRLPPDSLIQMGVNANPPAKWVGDAGTQQPGSPLLGFDLDVYSFGAGIKVYVRRISQLGHRRDGARKHRADPDITLFVHLRNPLDRRVVGLWDCLVVPFQYGPTDIRR